MQEQYVAYVLPIQATLLLFLLYAMRFLPVRPIFSGTIFCPEHANRILQHPVASFFSETEERKLLIHILRRAEKEDGWPTT
jgi:hypothetical protein